MAPATEALQSPCLTGPITDYSWAEGIALMTVFTMFFIELMASRFDVFGSHEHESADPATNLLRDAEKYGGSDSAAKKCKHDLLYILDSRFSLFTVSGAYQLAFYDCEIYISVLIKCYSNYC